MKNRNQPQSASPLTFPPRLLSYEIGTLYQQGKREEQQDSMLTINASDVTLMRLNGLLVAVADGMGGMTGGKQAGQTVVQCLEEGYQNIDLNEKIGQQISEIVKEANDRVYDILHGRGGSTLVAGCIYKERFSWASVGDSYMFLKRGNAVYRINQDMNVRIRCYREMLVEDSIDTSYGDENPERNALWTFVGMEQMNRDPEYSHISLQLQDQDVLLLCSDGVAGVMTEQEILSAMALSNAADICESLHRYVELKHLRNQDNYTAIVVRCSY